MEKFLNTILKAAVSAGSSAMEVYGGEFSVSEKQDRTPVTLADTRAHSIICSALEETGIPVLSEEGAETPYSERRQWQRLWIVDPLDGTKEFVKRNGEFTINIALIENQRPVMGTVFIPVLSRLYYAVKGRGAWRAEVEADDRHTEESLSSFLKKNAEPIRVKPDASRRFTIVGSRSHLTPEVEQFVDEKKRVFGDAEFVSAGSSLKFCRIAEGGADIYPRLGPTMEWDTAAGHVIALAAGARVYRYDTGGELLYNKQDLKNPWFVVTNGRDEQDRENS